MKFTIINSDVYAGLFNLENNSISVTITSPPYWGQRDYGFEGQIGNEKSFEEYIAKLITIFNLLKQKVTDEGVFFLNIGDKYINKYGKSPLAFIPYKLAHFMIENGWILNDILIWYKPNHMPSSIKNRFSNSYEPVFVFSKNYDNIFSRKNPKSSFSNILKINLQPTNYKHVAVFPEKLVKALLNMVIIQDEMTILDPFAGSGTTLKVVKNFPNNLNSIMIENHSEYVEIIKKRSELNGQVKVLNFNYVPYYFKSLPKFEQLTLFEKSLHFNDKINFIQNGFVKIYDNQKDYYGLLNKFSNRSINNSNKHESTYFLGSKDFDIKLIYKTSELNNKGWIIRNLIIVERNSRWFPIFMVVDDNKKSNYIFNYKNLNLKSKNKEIKNWSATNFLGFRVVNSIGKKKNTGLIVEILSKRENGFPLYVVVKWSDNKFSKEFVIFSQEEIFQNIIIQDNYFIKEINNITSLNNSISYNIKFKNAHINKMSKEYNGKFKDEKRINWGASPGARSSIEQEYFSVQRLYEVDQKLIANYLNHLRCNYGLSKQDLINMFPKNYKHTVGHWLRTDFGGSLPKPEDWFKLTEIFKIDENITNYVCKTALKLQTVTNGDYKIPEDFININSVNILNDLLKI